MYSSVCSMPLRTVNWGTACEPSTCAMNTACALLECGDANELDGCEEERHGRVRDAPSQKLSVIMNIANLAWNRDTLIVRDRLAETTFLFVVRFSA